MALKILLLSAYEAKSHEYWASCLIDNLKEFQFTKLTLPSRFFAWRVRGNPISWYEQLKNLDTKFDLIIATSLTDLNSIKGMHPHLAVVPSIIYFHENQFAYPENKLQQNLEAKIVSIYNALSADLVLFNSEYNLETFFEGTKTLLKKMPDHSSLDLNIIKQKSEVISVPIIPKQTFKKATNSCPTFVWNHRWEYDKAPERLHAFLKELDKVGIDFKINIIGQSFKNQPKVFDEIKSEFSDNIDHFGFVDRQTYWKILELSDYVLSTAIHDFQGLSVMEAYQYQCTPILPNRQAYPQWFNDQFLYSSHINDIYMEAKSMVECFLNLENSPPVKKNLLAELEINKIIEKYHSRIENISRLNTRP